MRPSPRWLTPNICLGASLALIFVCAAAAPKLVYKFSQDGGFLESGERINLGRWTHISAHRNGGAILAINVPDRNPAEHYESWINAGQWLRFNDVPATQRSRFTAEVRVHPAWPRDRATEVTFSAFGQAKGLPDVGVALVQSLDKQTEWSRIELDLSPLAGRNIRIKIAPTADQEVWTLMRDPRIEVARDPIQQ